VERMGSYESGGLWRFSFLHNTKSPLFGGTKTLYWRSVEGFGGFE